MPATITSANSIFSNSFTALQEGTSGTTSVFGGGYVIAGANSLQSALYLGQIFSSTTHTVNIDGAVMAFGSAADSDGIYVFGDATADINVGTTGVVYGRTNAIDASGQTDIFNAGTISNNSGDPTIRIGISAPFGATYDNLITNDATGRIANDQGVAIAYDAGGTHTLVNNGVISSALNFFSIWGVNNSIELVTNNGLLNNGVTLGAGNDRLDTRLGKITGLTSSMGDGADRYFGSTTAADAVNGDAGNDVLYGYGGNDTLSGGTGNDTLFGGAGGDTLTTGTGFNVVRYVTIADSTVAAAGRDTFTDFSAISDTFDVASIDANTSVVGNNAFTYLGSAAFTGLGQIRAVQSGADTILEFNTTGTTAADMAILVQNTLVANITAADFIL